MGKVVDTFIFKNKSYTKEQFSLLKDNDLPKTLSNSQTYASITKFIEDTFPNNIDVEVISNIDTGKIIVPLFIS
jgi:hypothetical protein